MPDPLFDGLYQEADKLRWPTSDEVRRRGHLAQVRRRAAVAAAAVLVVLAGGALAGQALGVEAPQPPAGSERPVVTTSPSPSQEARPSPSVGPSPAQSADPSPSAPANPSTSPPDDEDLASAFLRVEDLQPGEWERRASVDGDWSFAFSASLCAEQLPVPVGAVDSQGQAYVDGSQVVVQRVDRYAPGDAERYLDHVRTQVHECGGFPTSEGLSIIDEGFAGAESLLIRALHENGGDTQHLLVRQGDLVTEIWTKPAPDAYAVPLAQRAADRLCRATAC